MLLCSRMRPQQLAFDAAQPSGALQQYDWRPCTSPANFSGLGEGKWGLTLQASNRAGLLRTTRWAAHGLLHAAWSRGPCSIRM